MVAKSDQLAILYRVMIHDGQKDLHTIKRQKPEIFSAHIHNFDFCMYADRNHNFSQSIREMEVKIIFKAFLFDKHYSPCSEHPFSSRQTKKRRMAFSVR